MQLGHMHYLQVGKNLNVTTNFNHLGKGGRFEPWLQGPWPLQHNETIAIDQYHRNNLQNISYQKHISKYKPNISDGRYYEGKTATCKGIANYVQNTLKNLPMPQHIEKHLELSCISQNTRNNFNKQKVNCNYNFQQNLCIHFNPTLSSSL